MNEGCLKAYEFLKKNKTYYLATVDEDNCPHLRPFGTVLLYQDRLYIQTGKKKNVYKQLRKNPASAVCCFDGTTWLRIEGKLIEDNRISVQEKMLDDYPELKKMYQAGDGNTTVFYFIEAKITFSSFKGEEKEYKI
jgi:uncharacterized pyridoxamine 5'-phosphate oxidase family protein